MITKVEMKRLKTHSKKHKGGMNGKHMQNMKKFMKNNNDSFIVAHNKAKKLDKKKSNKKRSGY